MHEILDIPDSNIVGVKLSDTLTEADFEPLVSHLRSTFQQHTTMRVFFELDDVSGWSPEDRWEDLTFDIRHVRALDKVAVVGDESTDFWDTWIEKSQLLFPYAELQTFPPEEQETALQWIRGEMEVPGIGPGSVSDPQAGAQDE